MNPGWGFNAEQKCANQMYPMTSPVGVAERRESQREGERVGRRPAGTEITFSINTHGPMRWLAKSIFKSNQIYHDARSLEARVHPSLTPAFSNTAFQHSLLVLVLIIFSLYP